MKQDQEDWYTRWVNPRNNGSDLIADPVELKEQMAVIAHNYPQRVQDRIVVKVRKYREE